MAVRDVTAPGEHLIELDAVSRTFETPAGRITAVDRVSLAFAASEAMCLVGESGCGKTTTGRLLAGLLRPTGGRLLFEGKDVWRSQGEDLAIEGDTVRMDGRQGLARFLASADLPHNRVEAKICRSCRTPSVRTTFAPFGFP